MNKRIVVTGMGALTPLGCGVEQIWQRLLAGQSGIRRLPEELIGDLAISIGGQVQDRDQDPQAGFDPDALLAPKEQRKMDRFILFALAAAEEALVQAGWHPETAEEQERTATIIASGVGGFPAIAEAVRTTDSKGPRRLSPFTIPSLSALRGQCRLTTSARLKSSSRVSHSTGTPSGALRCLGL